MDIFFVQLDIFYEKYEQIDSIFYTRSFSSLNLAKIMQVKD